MSLKESEVSHKMTDEMLIAGIRFRGEREEIETRRRELHEACKDIAIGPWFTIYRYDTGKEGVDIEVCYPVSQAIDKGEVESRTLESIEVASITHHGPRETLGETMSKLISFFREHGVPGHYGTRTIYLKTDPEHPENDVIEVQVPLHPWNSLFAQNLERVMGAEVRDEVMKGSENVTFESTALERATWVREAIERFDELADGGQKYEVLSRCAHAFAPERIEALRAVYEQAGDVDEVLKVMYDDPDWYEDPEREGNIIYVTKIPARKEAYEEETDATQKKKLYCHCPIAGQFLDMMPETFCCCSAGWYRQLWEGILQKPVRIEILKTITGGDDDCRFAIHLPS